MLKTILNHSNYAITKDGQVWSKQNYIWLKPINNKKGYYWVTLCSFGKRSTKYIHRLVLETYVGPCPKDMESRHLNGIKTDNRLENLCWGTSSENSIDAVNHGTSSGLKNKGEKNNHSKLTEKDVINIIKWYEMELFTQCQLAKLHNVDQSSINGIVNKRTWKYLWGKNNE